MGMFPKGWLVKFSLIIPAWLLLLRFECFQIIHLGCRFAISLISSKQNSSHEIIKSARL